MPKGVLFCDANWLVLVVIEEEDFEGSVKGQGVASLSAGTGQGEKLNVIKYLSAETHVMLLAGIHCNWFFQHRHRQGFRQSRDQI